MLAEIWNILSCSISKILLHLRINVGHLNLTEMYLVLAFRIFRALTLLMTIVHRIFTIMYFARDPIKKINENDMFTFIIRLIPYGIYFTIDSQINFSLKYLIQSDLPLVWCNFISSMKSESESHSVESDSL